MVQQRTGGFVKRKAALKYAADLRKKGRNARVRDRYVCGGVGMIPATETFIYSNDT